MQRPPYSPANITHLDQRGGRIAVRGDARGRGGAAGRPLLLFRTGVLGPDTPGRRRRLLSGRAHTAEIHWVGVNVGACVELLLETRDHHADASDDSVGRTALLPH